MLQLGFHWTDFHEIWYLRIFSKNLSRNFKLHYNVTRVTVLHMKTGIHLWSYLGFFFLEREMFQTKVLVKHKTQVLSSLTFFFENFNVYGIIWKNMVQPDRPQLTIWPMRIACSIPKATNTRSEYVILFLRDMHISCLVTLSFIIFKTKFVFILKGKGHPIIGHNAQRGSTDITLLFP
jgi:hypothetical protein